jgi:hypothetical protein
VIARVVANDDSAVAYLRQGVQFKLLLDANVQVDGSQAHELYVGGVLQSSTLNYPAEVVFGVSLTTPAGLAVLKLYVGGRLSGWATVVVQPQNGFLANT